MVSPATDTTLTPLTLPLTHRHIDLTDDATILYSSDSVVDILGYTPDEIVNRSAWDFFPEEELAAAQQFHRRRVSSDKAAVLAYIRVRDRQGQWVGCECCLTIVYDVMVVCTSIYRRGLKSESMPPPPPITSIPLPRH
jgi:PAS domain S-box-containing protein